MENLQKIKEYLANPVWPHTSDPKEIARVQGMGDVLMNFAPGRYRLNVRRLMTAPLPHVIRETNENLISVARQLSQFGDLKRMQDQMPKVIEDTKVEVQKAEAVVKSAEEHTKGKRADHEQLPAHIQSLYEDNLTLLQKQRSMHEKMKLYYRQMLDQRSSRSAAPCDIEETCHALRAATAEVVALNDRRLANWHKYDEYQLTPATKEAEAIKKSCDIKPDMLRDFQNAKTYLSRNITKLSALNGVDGKKTEFEERKMAMQERVNTMLRAGFVWPENSKWLEPLHACGIITTLQN